MLFRSHFQAAGFCLFGGHAVGGAWVIGMLDRWSSFLLISGEEQGVTRSWVSTWGKFWVVCVRVDTLRRGLVIGLCL